MSDTFPHTARLRPSVTTNTLWEIWQFGGRRVFVLYFLLGLILYMRGSSTSRSASAAAKAIPRQSHYICKDVLFIRHAEGIHNRDEAIYPDYHTSGRSTWADYYDSGLTEAGKRQAEAFTLPASSFATPDVLVTSPLSRAIDTGLMAFPHYHASGKVVATDLCRERIAKYTSDVRKSRTQLEKLYPQVDFTLLQTDLDVAFETSKEMHPHEYNSDACKARAQRFVSCTCSRWRRLRMQTS
ncbi:hypothetical protein BASA81_000819 [Batrachochytrium salamandrivorans]|nr:hypothetical protein BASA81_000819 [Batrachochytrium salamandrivorans]